MKQLKKDNQGIIGLYYNDTPLVCPLTPPVLLPGQMAGTASVHQRHCNELCPLFKIETNGLNTADNKFITLCQNKYTLRSPPEQAPKSSIITLSNENKAL